MPLWQVEDHTFFTQAIDESSVVLSLGANHGAFAHALLQRFGCRVYAVEANPQLCAEIPPHPKLTVLNYLVSTSSGKQPFYIAANDEFSSALRPRHGSAARAVEVESISLQNLVSQLKLTRIDLLKLDIEGSEIEVLESCPTSLLQSCAQITVEFHDFNRIVTHEAADRIVRRIEEAGFDVLKMWARSHGDTLFVNRAMAEVSRLEWLTTRYGVRNWWWLRRFVKRKLGLSR